MNRSWILQAITLAVVIPLFALGEEMDSLIPEDAFAQVVYTWDAETSFEESTPGKVTCHEVEAVAALPVYQQDAFSFLLGGGIKWNQFAFTGIDMSDEDVYTLTLPFDLIYEGPGDWSFWANITPGLFSDLRRVDGDDYKTLFHGLAMYDLFDCLTLTAGAAYDSAFGKDEWYPLGGVIWHINEQWELRLILPNPFLYWAPNRKLLLFAGAMPAGDKWNMRDPDTFEGYDFKLESWRAGGGFEYQLAGPAWFHLSAGADIDRKYVIENETQTLLDSKADDTFFVRTGLVFR